MSVGMYGWLLKVGENEKVWKCIVLFSRDLGGSGDKNVTKIVCARVVFFFIVQECRQVVWHELNAKQIAKKYFLRNFFWLFF